MGPKNSPEQNAGQFDRLRNGFDAISSRLNADGVRQVIACFAAAAVATTGAYELNARAHAEPNPPGEICVDEQCEIFIDEQSLATGGLSAAQSASTDADTFPTGQDNETGQIQTRREPLKSRLEGRIENIPSLKELGSMFPDAYGDWQQQLGHINNLVNGFEVTPRDYSNMKVDRQFTGVFSDIYKSEHQITPKIIALHWTGVDYPQGPAGGQLFAESLLRKGLSSQYLIPKSAETVFSYFPDDLHKAAGILGLNDEAVNLEIEANLLPGKHAPQTIYSIRPEQIKAATLMVVNIARRNGLAINEYTVADHLSLDMIYNNPTFNPATRTVGSIRKFDFPHELTEGIIKKAQILDAQLNALEQR